MNVIDTASRGPCRVADFPLPSRPAIDMDRLISYRLARIRAELQAADCAMAVLLNPVSLRYAVDWREYALFQSRLPSYYLYVPVEGPVVMHGAYGGNCAAVDAYRPADYLNVFDGGLDLADNAEALAGEMVGFLRDIGITDKHPRVAAERFNPSAAGALLNAGLELVDGEPLLEKARYRKSDDELACMRYSIAVAQHGMAQMQDAMRAGMTENALFSVLHKVNIQFDGDWIDGRMLASGPRTNPWYQEASDRAIEAGDLVAFDTDMIGPYGYCADISRTWLCASDKPTDAQRDVYSRAYDEVHTNIAMIKAGMSFREVSELGYRQAPEFIANRYACLAHGVGMTDEYPKIYYREDWARHGYDGVIEPNTVLCVESFTGSDRGGPGVKLEEMVLVTEAGCEPLSSYPYDDVLLGRVV